MDAYREREWSAVLEAVEKVYHKLTWLSELGNELLRPRLEAVLAGRFDTGLPSYPERFSPLRDNRPTWLERGGHYNDESDPIPGRNLLDDDALFLAYTDVRRRITPISGARPIRPSTNTGAIGSGDVRRDVPLPEGTRWEGFFGDRLEDAERMPLLGLRVEEKLEKKKAVDRFYFRLPVQQWANMAPELRRSRQLSARGESLSTVRRMPARGLAPAQSQPASPAADGRFGWGQFGGLVKSRRLLLVFA